jgi:hypothetical protein
MVGGAAGSPDILEVDGMDTPIKGSASSDGDPGLDSISMSLPDEKVLGDCGPLMMNWPVLCVRTRFV